MLNYLIREIDVRDPSISGRVCHLLNEVSHSKMQPASIWLKTFTQSRESSSLYLGAFIGDEIVGFNAYISHDFIFNGEFVNCFQACLTATSSEHRRRGIYFNLRQTAIDLLRDRGTAFIFSYPNHNSGPILLKTFGFKVIGTLYIINIPNVPLWADSFFTDWEGSNYLTMADSYLQNDYQLIKLKKKQYGEDIKIVSDCGNMIWGKIAYKMLFGIRMKYFDVGGMIVEKPYSFKLCVKEIMSTYKIAFIQFAINSSSYFNRLFRRNKISNDEPLMIYELNGSHAEKRFNLLSGVRDTF